MKHTPKVTYILISLFLLSQLLGLLIISRNIDIQETKDPKTGEIQRSITYAETPYLETVETEDESFSFIPIFIAIIIGTIFGLLIAKFRKIGLWKVWFSLAVLVTLYKSFSSFAPALAAGIAAAVFALWKIYRPNFIVHNLTELFIYPGLAAIFVPILNVFSASVLLILISIYDAYAVWKSKHMIALAKFQASSIFAGLSLHYDTAKNKVVNIRGAKLPIPKPKMDSQKSTIRSAILGGGDMAFPLLFSGAVLKGLLLETTLASALLKSAAISIFAAAALSLLFLFAKREKFYPAMPFLAAGCFIGYGLVLLL